MNSVFLYYSATGTGDAFDMGLNDMYELLRACDLKPETNISVIWASTNYNKRKSKRNGLDQAVFDDDARALSRYEFLELILRLASWTKNTGKNKPKCQIGACKTRARSRRLHFVAGHS